MAGGALFLNPLKGITGMSMAQGLGAKFMEPLRPCSNLRIGTIVKTPNSLKGGYVGDYPRGYSGGYRSLDYSSYEPKKKRTPHIEIIIVPAL